MDELEIGGKKYLSSRRAAKENKYHTDYIGQLIRAGKIVGKKVGRAWYVEEGSLNSYLKSESGTPAAAAMAAPVEVAQEVPEAPQIEKIEETQEPAIVQSEEPIPEPEVMAPEIIEEEKVPVRTEQRIHITLAEKNISHIQPKKNTLTYVEDTEPLLPVLEGRARANADFVSLTPRRQPQETEVYEEKIGEETPETPVTRKGFRISLFHVTRVSTLAAVAVVTLAFFTGVSVFVATSIKVKDGQPASVAFTIK